jgi:hypothetical protein
MSLTPPEESEGVEGFSASGRVVATVETFFDIEAGRELFSSGSLVVILRASLPEAASLADWVSVTKLNLVDHQALGPTGRK